MFGFGNTKTLTTVVTSLRQEIKSLQNSFQEWGGTYREQWSDFFGLGSSSGTAVTYQTAKRSAAVYACTRIIASAIAIMPLPVYERTRDGGRRKADHAFWWLLNESPYPSLTSCSFWEWMIASMLLKGDGIAQIVRDKNGYPVWFKPIARQCVSIKFRDDTLIYLINDGTKQYGLHQDDVLHFPGFGFDGIEGESVIRFAARQAIGTALAADEFSGEFFANGTTPSAVITYPAGVAPTDPQKITCDNNLKSATQVVVIVTNRYCL